MASRKYLWKHSSGIYYYRRRYNKETAALLGKEIFKKSLESKDDKRANLAYAIAEQDYVALVKGEIRMSPSKVTGSSSKTF